MSLESNIKYGLYLQQLVFKHDLQCMKDFETLKIDSPLDIEQIPATLEALEKKRVELQADKERQIAELKLKVAQLTVSETAAATESDAAVSAEPASTTATEPAEAPKAVEASA